MDATKQNNRVAAVTRPNSITVRPFENRNSFKLSDFQLDKSVVFAENENEATIETDVDEIINEKRTKDQKEAELDRTESTEAFDENKTVIIADRNISASRTTSIDGDAVSTNKSKSINENTQPVVAKEKLKRTGVYNCLCPKLSEKVKNENCLLRTCITSICGFPIYSVVIAIVLGCVIISALITLIYLCVAAETKNSSYFAKCSSNSDCNAVIGLHCSAEDNICNCPAGKTKGRCDCSVGYFWNGVKCARLLQYLESGCAYDYNCDSTRELKCLNKVCRCRPPQMWIQSAQTCDFNYLGCFEEVVPAWYLTSSPNQKMFYFVDFCLNLCKDLQLKYAFINNGHFCYCNNATVQVLPRYCDLTCMGKNNKPYMCGSRASGTGSYRSIYEIALN